MLVFPLQHIHCLQVMKAAHRGSKRPSEEDADEVDVKPKKTRAKAAAKATAKATAKAAAKAKAKGEPKPIDPKSNEDAGVKEPPKNEPPKNEPPKNDKGEQVDAKDDAPTAVDLGEAWGKKDWSIVCSVSMFESLVIQNIQTSFFFHFMMQ